MYNTFFREIAGFYLEGAFPVLWNASGQRIGWGKRLPVIVAQISPLFARPRVFYLYKLSRTLVGYPLFQWGAPQLISHQKASLKIRQHCPLHLLAFVYLVFEQRPIFILCDPRILVFSVSPFPLEPHWLTENSQVRELMRPLSKMGTGLLKGRLEAFSTGNRLSVVVELKVVSHLNLPVCPYSKSWVSSLLLFLPLVSPQRSA